MVVSFLAAVVIGVLAHRSPKGDWEFIKQGPALVLFNASGAVAQAEIAPTWVAGDMDYTCDWVPNEDGLLTQECGIEIRGGGFVEPSFDLGTLAWTLFGGTIVSMVLDGPAEVVGVAVGIGVGKVAFPPSSQPPPPPPLEASTTDALKRPQSSRSPAARRRKGG